MSLYVHFVYVVPLGSFFGHVWYVPPAAVHSALMVDSLIGWASAAGAVATSAPTLSAPAVRTPAVIRRHRAVVLVVMASPCRCRGQVPRSSARRSRDRRFPHFSRKEFQRG